jgi:Asp-tRNA(Asn)/Glu-tRNA(Gln) amidotransferase A subunit family amidase
VRLGGMGDLGSDLWHMSATELAGAIRTSRVSSREVVRAHLERIETVNP